jgi:hypothetical protein
VAEKKNDFIVYEKNEREMEVCEKNEPLLMNEVDEEVNDEDDNKSTKGGMNSKLLFINRNTGKFVCVEVKNMKDEKEMMNNNMKNNMIMNEYILLPKRIAVEENGTPILPESFLYTYFHDEILPPKEE